MIDAVYAPFLERIAASVPYYKGLPVRNNKWAAVDGWYNAMDTRPAYQAMKSDDFTHVHDLPPQIGECYHNEASKEYWDLVDGKKGSWSLPLKPETTAWGYDEGKQGKDEAAWNLVNNHAAVIKFASRKLRNEAEAYADAVDVTFRYVAKSMIEGTKAVGPLPKGLPAKQVKLAAEHLRDNVGVPRDMSYPAARQLRAHLNWAIDQL
jgi:glutathione S-transferase